MGLDQSSRRRRRLHAGPRASAFILDESGRLAGSWAAPVGEVSHLREAFERSKEIRGAGERRGSTLCLHLIVGVSPDALAGDIHDPDNEAGRMLLAEAVRWAESEFGPQSVFAARRDIDEEGAAVADVFVAPVAMLRAGRGAPKPTISVKKALEACANRAGRLPGDSYGALQDTWAKAARAIHPDLRRGIPKVVTGRSHVHADVYKREAEKARLRAHRVAARLEEAARIEAARIVEAAHRRATEAAAEAKRTEAVQMAMDQTLTLLRLEGAQGKKVLRGAQRRQLHEGIRQRPGASAGANRNPQRRGQRSRSPLERPGPDGPAAGGGSA